MFDILKVLKLRRKLKSFIGSLIHNQLILNDGIKIGRYTYGIKNSTILFVKTDSPINVEIGNFCSFAEGVKLLVNLNHRLSCPSTFPFKTLFFRNDERLNKDATSKGPIKIGHDVWIGQDAIVLSGVEIGTGAVVGAGAVVTKDIPPYAVAVGVPAKVIKFRFPENIILRLLKSEWWNLPDNDLMSMKDFFYTDNIDSFLNKVDTLKNHYSD